MAKSKRILVYPNPYMHLDHDGYPAGATPTDRMEHVGETVRSWVGAKLDQDQTFHTENLSSDEQAFRFPRQQTRFKFELSTPTELPVTQYYRDRIRDGELFVADEASAKECGFAFTDPKKALHAAKAAAIASWKASYGELPEFVDALDVGFVTSQGTGVPMTGTDVPADGVERSFQFKSSPAFVAEKKA